MQSETPTPLTPEEETQLRESLKRCPAGTIEAALAFRNNGDDSQIPLIVTGIAERFLEPDIRPKLRSGDDSLRVFEDLGIDSLTMVEIVMLIEEVLAIKIDNEELRDLRTIGDVKTFIDCKVTGKAPPEKPLHLTIENLLGILPHQPPFLFLQEADVTSQGATGLYRISGDEHFLEGHFRNNPVFPASIMLEALGQLGVLHLLAAKDPTHSGKAIDPASIFFISCGSVRAQRICKPGDTLLFSIRTKRIRHPMATFDGQIMVGTEKTAFAEEISLSFDYKKEETPAT